VSETVDYPPATERDSHLLTVLIADVRGYSQYTHERGDEAGAQLAAAFAALAREAVSDAGGSVVELRGDEALAVFASARKAARASVDLQSRCMAAMERDPSLQLRVGIGLDAGDIVPVENGYRGRALNVAARLCDLAGPGEILAGEGLVHLAGTVDGLAFVSRGGVGLKGMDKVRVYQLGRAGELPDRLPALAEEAGGETPGVVLGYVAAGIGVAAILIELLVSTISVGFLVRVGIAGFVCIAGFAGGRLASMRLLHGVEWIYLTAAVTLVVTLSWIAVIPAVLFLIAAGMAFFGQGSAPPSRPPPGQQ
jgi:class 3 adenylate cyclase